MDIADMNSPKKILIITTGQPSSNPRMLKEYTVLKHAGYNVKVLYAFWVGWAFESDRKLFEAGTIDRNDFILVGGNPVNGKITWLFSRIFFKTIRTLSQRLGIPFPKEWMISRPSFFLERAAKKRQADLYIAHNLGALPASIKAAERWKTRSGFDAEDYHRGEYGDPSGWSYDLTKSIEDEYLPRCTYTTAAAPLIAKAYRSIAPLQDFMVINNVFPVTHLQPQPGAGNKSLRIFWFSQTIGPDRGLETMIEAINRLPDRSISLHLMGQADDSFREKILSLAADPARVHFIPPVLPDDIFRKAAEFDIGFAAEVPHCENRDFCLTNKLFTYLLAGNCLLASDTSAQKLFFSAYPGLGLLYRSGDAGSLMEQLEKLYADREFVQLCRTNALQLAGGSLNWEQESKLFIDRITSILED